MDFEEYNLFFAAYYRQLVGYTSLTVMRPRMISYLIYDELQRVSWRHFNGRLGQQEFSVVAPSDDHYGFGTLDPHWEVSERVQQQYQMKWEQLSDVAYYC